MLSLIEIEAQHFIQDSSRNRNVEGEIKSIEEDKAIACDMAELK